MNTQNRSSRVLVAAPVVMATFVFSASTASAELIGQLGILNGGADLTGLTNPATGLDWEEGDTYRLIFATSTGRDALSTDINDYNTFVNDAANAVGAVAGLSGTTWRALASTETVAANANTSTNTGTGESFWLVNGTTLVADNYADLYGSGTHSNAVNMSETGGAPLDAGDFTSLWTGSDGAGNIKTNVGSGIPGWLGYDGAEGNVGSPPVGVNNSHGGLWNFTSGAHWIDRFNLDNSRELALYGVSEVLTVQGPPPLPEPSTFALAALGLMGFVSTRRRRRNRG